MTDLIARLRERATAIPGEIAERENEASSHCGPYGTDTAEDYMDDEDVLLMHDAADQLSALRERVEALEGALRKIANDPYQHGQRVQKMKAIARAALSAALDIGGGRGS